MEEYQYALKSVLKKPNEPSSNKTRKVKFLNTVKVFIEPEGEDSFIIDIDESKLKCVEISIIDKSNEGLNCDTSDEVTDFLVHKVTYDEDYALNENEDNDVQNDSPESETIVFASEAEEENLEFVVHKVTEHEDDLIQQELDLDNNQHPDDETNQVDDLIAESESISESISKLSIENIIEHDKIIAFIDQANLNLASSLLNSKDTPCKNLSEDKSLDETNENSVILSPPLQELSLETIVKAHSANILSELDISPLNSVQETDSDSDLSSEGTMIMMTSEECKRNEDRIRQSLLHFESLKQKKAQETALGKTTDQQIEELEPFCEEYSVPDCFSEDSTPEESDTSFDSVIEVTANCTKIEEISSDLNVKEVNKTMHLSTNDISNLPTDVKTARSSSLPTSNLLHQIPVSKFMHTPKKTHSHNVITYPVKRLTSVKIPSDLREWKISPEKDLKNVSHIRNPAKASQSNHSSQSTRHISSSTIQKQSDTLQKTDELENFVHESTERVERIRKRYTSRSHPRTYKSPVRGVRPRFGSTAEILQLMQKQNCPPMITFSYPKNHSSWPCERSDGSLPHHFRSQSDCSSHSSLDSDDLLNSGSEHSMSSCPPIMMQERGVPEGSSPPRLQREIILNDEAPYNSSNKVVYYSMKV